MSNPISEPGPGPDELESEDIEDQDAEPSLNAPEEGRPDGIEADDDE